MKKQNEKTETVAAYINNVPVGTVMPFMGLFEKIAGLTATGWHYCNGDALNKDQYPLLFDMLGYSCGGSGLNFHLPDIRGIFVRGVDGGRRQDTDAADRVRQGTTDRVGDIAGSYQSDQFKKHSHKTKVYTPNGWFSITNREHDWNPPVDNTAVQTEPQDEGGSETRPKNISAYYIIFAGLPKNA